MRTKAHRGFLPSRLDGLELEVRVVLSQGTLTAPVLVLNPARHSARALRHLSPQDKVNQAFDRFTTDYLQAQQVYLASTGLPASGVNSAESAFKDFTTLRVNLLSQELVQALGRLPGATTKLRPNQRLTQSMSTTLQSFLYRKIDGKIQPSARSDTSNSDPNYGNISLLTTLTRRRAAGTEPELRQGHFPWPRPPCSPSKPRTPLSPPALTRSTRPI